MSTYATTSVTDEPLRPVAPGRAARSFPGLAAVRPVVLGAAGIALVIAAWAALSAGEVVDRTSLPAPGAVAGRIVDLLGDGRFRGAVIDTVRAWCVAMMLAGSVAIPLGLVVGHVSWLERPIGFVVDAARSVPSTALIPVAIILWGLGDEMKWALVIYAVFWPMLINSMYGARSVDPMMKSVARSLRWGRFTTMRWVVLPSAAPSIATGVRVAAAIGLIVVLSAELLGASDGIGTEILLYQDANQPDFVYAAIVLIGVLGVVIAGLLVAAERMLVPWAHAQRSRA
jgi:ABC-type nitrate/sulfonate/bicarbonate transport system permease component